MNEKILFFVKIKNENRILGLYRLKFIPNITFLVFSS